MKANSAGSYLTHTRKKKRRSLQHVSRRMGRKGLSKQALSLIERSRMRIPSARLPALNRAYSLSAEEQKELARLYAFEKLVEHTGEDREFGEAVLSVIDPEKTTTIYVIGGRKLSLSNRPLQEKAAEFLQRPANQLIFLYPDNDALRYPNDLIWFPNTRREMMELKESIQSFSKRELHQQIRFYGLNVQKATRDPLLLSALSLCSPFTATTIASLQSANHAVGYVYVEGSKDRWVLLRAENAKRALQTVTLLLRTVARNDAAVNEETLN